MFLRAAGNICVFLFKGTPCLVASNENHKEPYPGEEKICMGARCPTSCSFCPERTPKWTDMMDHYCCPCFSRPRFCTLVAQEWSGKSIRCFKLPRVAFSDSVEGRVYEG